MLANRYDVFSVLHVCVYFAVCHFAWVRHDATQWMQAWLSTALVSYYAFACGCVAHNSMHCRTFEHRGLETAYHQILTLTFGHPVSTLVPGHNLSHHRHTQTTLDAMRTSKVRFEWHFLNLLLFQPTVARDVFAVDMRYLSMQKMMNRAFFGQACAQFAVLLVSQAVLLWMDWRRFLLYVYLPHVFAQWAIVTMNLLQHDGCHVPCSDDTPAQRYNTARNFTGRVLNLLTFNNGYHTIHHMFPRMHWSRLREEHNRQVKPHIHPALEQSSLGVYLFRTFVFPGRRLDYLGAPVVLAPEQPDEDWTLQYAAPGLVLEDYDVDMDVRGRLGRIVSGVGTGCVRGS